MKRKMFTSLYNHIEKKEFTILTGARQVGKTTLLKQLEEKANNEGKTTFFVTFENPDILNAINKHPENIMEYFSLSTQNNIPASEKTYLFIDEVQYADNPSNFLKLLFDKYADRLKIIATGSSAFYIDRKFKDSLAGRKRLFELFTMDFEEFLFFKNQKELLIELKRLKEDYNNKSLNEREINHLFNEYLTYGGYPAVVLENNIEQKRLILNELINTYVKKDALESKVSNEEVFFNLLRILASQTGNLLNMYELANTLRVSHSAIENYIYILKKCFYIHLIKPFYANIRKELSKMPKVFFNDLGLKNILLNYFDPVTQRIDKGELLENYIFTRLRDLYHYNNINFWRTTQGNEIDFIVSESFRKGKAYEVKFSETMFKEKKYQKFTSNYPDYELKCIAFEAFSNAIPAMRI